MTKQPEKPKTFTPSATGQAERIAKRIARAGICSRRQAEAYIAEGRVRVNGQTLSSPAFTVTNTDKVEVDGIVLAPAEPPRLWRYYKPRGLVVSNKDEKGRETIFNHLPANLPRVISVGRLDMDSEGLLLLTNDGDLARHLELPSTGWMRKYRVRVHGQVDEKKLEDIAQGISIDGLHYGPVLARLDKQMTSNAWLTIAIREGRNREIRNIMSHLGYQVTRLLRLSYGPFLLGRLEQGGVEEVKPAILAQQLGLPVPEPVEKDGNGQRQGHKKLQLNKSQKPRLQKSGKIHKRAGPATRSKRPHASSRRKGQAQG